jgi:SAM-dependent methyltransferase
MFSASADLYDLIYAGIKDYAGETDRLAALLRLHLPTCHTVLDVGCGTGEHAFRLSSVHGFAADGLDLDPALLLIARRKHPEGRFFQADMADFRLPQRYDAVVSLFSSIAYLVTLERVTRALRCFHGHLEPGGLVVVEPWFPPGVLDPVRVATNRGEAAGVRVERTSRVEVDGRISRLHFEYDVTDRDGERRIEEVHELGLFTPEEMLEAFRAAGLSATHDPEGLTGRGLYVATATS